MKRRWGRCSVCLSMDQPMTALCRVAGDGHSSSHLSVKW